MKVLTVKQPWASLIVNEHKNMNLEVGKLNIEENSYSCW